MREGIFRELALARAGGKSVAALVAVALQRAGVKAVHNHRSVLQAWIKPLGEVRTAARELVSDTWEEARASERERSSKVTPVRIDRAKVLDKVLSQKQLITGAIARNELAKVYGLVDELVPFQMNNGSPIYAVKSLCDLAMVAQRHGAYGLQVDLLRRATRLKADDAWAWAQLGKALENTSEYGEALSAYDNSLNFGKEVVAKNGRAEVLKAMGRLDESLRAYEDAANLHPHDAIARNGRASVLANMRRWSEALALLPAHPPVAEQDWIGQHIRGMILLRTGDLQGAERIFESSVQHNPFAANRDYYRSALAVVRLRRHQYRAVLDLLTQVTLPVLQAPVNALRTHAYGIQHQHGPAAEAFARLPTQGPAVLTEVREELRRRFIDHEAPGHDEDWLIERELDLLAAA